MAQLKDSLITGDLRVTGKIYGLGTGLTNINASQITSGTLPVGRGGTGATTFTSGNLLVGAGTGAVTTIAKTNANTANTVVQRDGSGNFSAGTITASLTGHASLDLALTGGTMTGGITMPNDSSAWNTKGIIFTKGSRIGENTSGGLGVYAADKIYLRPSAGMASGSEGIEISSDGVYPSNNNSETLGTSDKKWSNVYATTFNGALNGTATNANYINLYEPRATTTTLNKTANYIGAGKMFHLVASSSTATTDNGKPPMGDANILQMNWDNNGGYDAQIAISTSANRMEFRDRPSTKNAWREVVTSTPGTAAGGSNKPVYINTTGVATEVTLTGATSLRNSLGLGTNADQLAIANGGTGKTTLTTAREQFNTPEFIVGTWTAASGTWTGVTTDSALYEGKQIILYMPFAGSGNATLNLTLSGGGTTGAKNVYFQSTTRMTTHYGAYSQVHLIYHAALNINGTTYEGWWSLPGRDTNDNYLATPYYYRPKTYTALYRYQVCLTKNETYILPINAVSNTTGTTKTLTTEEFDPFGPIFYYNNTNTVNADAYVPDGRLPQNMWVDLRYSFNTGQTLTANKAVYIVAEPQSNGMAKLYSTPITQTLPTASDGRIYILLGVAYNNQNIQMTPNHPVYYYAGNGIKLWTGIAGYTIWYDSSTQILHFDTIDNNDASSLSQAVAQLQSLHGVNSSTGTYKTVAQEISENKTITETTDFNISGNQFNMVVNS